MGKPENYSYPLFTCQSHPNGVLLDAIRLVFKIYAQNEIKLRSTMFYDQKRSIQPRDNLQLGLDTSN